MFERLSDVLKAWEITPLPFLKDFRVIRYIFAEIMPGFILGLVVFVLILLMFQVLRLTEFVLIHGVGLKIVLQLITYLSISFLPAILPMSVIFSVIMTYGRLSTDSEIIAIKSVGVNTWSLVAPAIVFGVLVGILSCFSSFYIGPWGNRQFEVLISQVGNQKVTASIREGAFADGFYDLVVYAKEVDTRDGILKNVFIYDERKDKMPLTIIAKKGIVLKDEQGALSSTVLRLIDGSIHRTSNEIYTKINFKSYDIFLSNPVNNQVVEKSPQSLKLSELNEMLGSTPAGEKKTKLQSEFHKRWSVTFACLAFSLLGVGLGIANHRRTQRVSGFVLSVGLIVVYWIMHIGMESVARSGIIPAFIALWVPSLFFFTAAFYTLKKIWSS